jgi:hypothetical protein
LIRRGLVEADFFGLRVGMEREISSNHVKFTKQLR